MSWQYWSSGVIYTGVGLLWLPFMLKYRITPYHLIYANPGLPYGGMEIGSKGDVLDHLKGTPYFLAHLKLNNTVDVSQNIRSFECFMETSGVGFPVIAKPDLGCIGFGVRRVESVQDLAGILQRSPVDYLVQEYCDLPKEYSIFFVRLPGEPRGIVPSLTEKFIPTVTGNGASTTRELVADDPRYHHNRSALLSHAKDLDRIPPAGERVDLLVQASHTYGTFFYDRNDRVDDRLVDWMNRLCREIPSFQFIRFDVKAAGDASLTTGEEIKILEVNGCMSEPIHMYDPGHRLAFGIRAFYRFYDMAFQVAKANKPRGERPPFAGMTRAFRRFFKNKREIMRTIG
ncbi:MAG: hypothetical protein PVH30_08825 [Desulfobacterales bacterium]|jgi:hypothetical protein